LAKKVASTSNSAVPESIHHAPGRPLLKPRPAHAKSCRSANDAGTEGACEKDPFYFPPRQMEISESFAAKPPGAYGEHRQQIYYCKLFLKKWLTTL
jgi:hypothetical protein